MPGAAAIPSSHHISERPAEYRTTASTIPAQTEQSSPRSESRPGDPWGGILAALKLKKPGLFSALGHSKIISQTDNDLVISVHGTAFQVQKAEEPESRALIEEIAADILGKKVRVKVQTAVAGVPSPAKMETKIKTVKTSKPEEQDPAMKDVLKAFPGAEIIESGGLDI